MYYGIVLMFVGASIFCSMTFIFSSAFFAITRFFFEVLGFLLLDNKDSDSKFILDTLELDISTICPVIDSIRFSITLDLF